MTGQAEGTSIAGRLARRLSPRVGVSAELAELRARVVALEAALQRNDPAVTRQMVEGLQASLAGLTVVVDERIADGAAAQG